MNYKNIACIALLLPIFSYGESKANRIKKLKKLQLEKLLELREIGEEISKSDKYIDYCRTIYSEKLRHLAQTKIKIILKEPSAEIAPLINCSIKKTIKSMLSTVKYIFINPMDTLENCRIEDITQSIHSENDTILNDLKKALTGEISFNHNLIEELFDINMSDDDEVFKSIKFILIRTKLEIEYMKLRTEQYQKCLQELLNIKKKLSS